MKRYWIEYFKTQQEGPMTFWVHREIEEKSQVGDVEYDPPRQAVVPGKGYPVFMVECDGLVFEFTSLMEMRVCIDTLGKKLLPRTIDLANERGCGAEPYTHWLSKLPSRNKTWRYREKAVAYLNKALVEFEKTIGKK